MSPLFFVLYSIAIHMTTYRATLILGIPSFIKQIDERNISFY